MSIKGSETGLALIVTLLLGLIAAGFIGALMYIMTTGTQLSGIETRYASAREAAKGGVSYISEGLSAGTLQCQDADGNQCYCDYMEANATGSIKCSTNSSSFADSATVLMDSASDLGDYNVNAELQNMVQNGTTLIFTFDLSASSNSTQESSNIEFVYKLE